MDRSVKYLSLPFALIFGSLIILFTSTATIVWFVFVSISFVCTPFWWLYLDKREEKKIEKPDN